MAKDCKLPCHHSDDVVATKTRLNTVENRQVEESGKHEQYRKDVHGRINDTNNLINLLRNDSFKAIEMVNRRADSMEHAMENLTGLTTDFKKFIGEATDTFSSIKDYMTKQEAKNTLKIQVISYTFKLAGFTLAILGIVQYIKHGL